MSRVHLVGGEKGGVGKSTVARLLCQWCIDRQRPWAALDADPAQGKLLFGYGERCQPVDLLEFESVDQIMDRALSTERLVVVDLPAQSQAPLSRWLGQSDVFGLAWQMGVRLVFWYVTDGGFDSLAKIEKLVRELPNTAEVVIVRNRRWLDDYSHLGGSPLERQLLARGGRFVDLPALDAALMHKVEARRVSLGQLSTEELEAPGALSRMERQRLSHWLGQTNAQLEPLLARSASEAANAAAASETAEVTEAAEPNTPGASPLRRPLPPVGSKWQDGARTWTEIGEGYQIHHVRC